MLENLLMECLGIEEREEFRGINKGINRKINLNLNCDRAFVRCKFKRYLFKINSKKIIMIDSGNTKTIIDFDYLGLNFSSLEDRNKVLEIITEWIKCIINNGWSIPYKIYFLD